MSSLQNKKTSYGFTLIELLVVISIIGLISSVLLVAVNSTRIKARDAKRRADLKQVSSALELYYADFATYLVTGTGYNGTGTGWLSSESGSPPYTTSVIRGLKNAGILNSTSLDDPKGPNPSYMIYVCGNPNGQKYSLYATLENPTAQEIAKVDTGCFGSTMYSTFGKNYMVGYSQ